MKLNKSVYLVILSFIFLLPNINPLSHEGNNEVDHSHSWCYAGDCGPNVWAGECQTGHHQSPIDISTLIPTREIHRDVKVHFSKSYGKSRHFHIQNNGHTVQLSLKSKSSQLYITLDDLDEKYIFEQMHFHWGSKNSAGSEHKIDQRGFSMEGHFVHFSEKYKDIAEAVGSNDKHALIVLGVFLNVGAEVKSVLTPIARAIPSYGKTKTLKVSLALLEFFVLTAKVYRYEGSLTTPPCSEIVLWHVFTHVVTVSKSDVAAFRKMKDANGHRLKKNYRPIQNKRTIEELGGESQEFYNPNEI